MNRKKTRPPQHVSAHMLEAMLALYGNAETAEEKARIKRKAKELLGK